MRSFRQWQLNWHWKLHHMVSRMRSSGSQRQKGRHDTHRITPENDVGTTVDIRNKKTKMIAHRGLSGIELENTCASFVAAGNRTYYGIEADIRRTRDGKFVIFHDDTTARLSDTNLLVSDTYYDTLRSLKLNDGSGRTDLIMPSLSEYVKICKKYNKICVLELKNKFQEKQIVEIAETIRALAYLDQVIFISFIQENLADLRKIYPLQQAQLLVNEFSEAIFRFIKNNRLGLDIAYLNLTEKIVKLVHEADLEVNCWTVNDPAVGKTLCRWGVDYITTNILE